MIILHYQYNLQYTYWNKYTYLGGVRLLYKSIIFMYVAEKVSPNGIKKCTKIDLSFGQFYILPPK